MSSQLIKFFNLTGLTWFVPLVKLAAGENPRQQFRQLFLIMGVPIIAMLFFLGFWNFSAARINTSLGTIPGPAAVLNEAMGLVDEHYAEKKKQADYYVRQEERIKKQKLEDPKSDIKVRPYNGNLSGQNRHQFIYRLCRFPVCNAGGRSCWSFMRHESGHQHGYQSADPDI
jgi:nitrate/nitrite transport system permease protein